MFRGNSAFDIVMNDTMQIISFFIIIHLDDFNYCTPIFKCIKHAKPVDLRKICIR